MRSICKSVPKYDERNITIKIYDGKSNMNRRKKDDDTAHGKQDMIHINVVPLEHGHDLNIIVKGYT